MFLEPKINMILLFISKFIKGFFVLDAIEYNINVMAVVINAKEEGSEKFLPTAKLTIQPKEIIAPLKITSNKYFDLKIPASLSIFNAISVFSAGSCTIPNAIRRIEVIDSIRSSLGVNGDIPKIIEPNKTDRIIPNAEDR